MASLDHRIDDLYKQPLSEFISARNELAKTLSGEDAKRVKALKKPTVVPWAVNQLYWSARATYDTLIKRGAALRNAQLSSLEGRRADVRAATEAHKKALLVSVKEALRIADGPGLKPDVELLTRTLEALSLAAAPMSERVGRLTAPLQPAGFEALTGATIEPSRPHAEGTASAAGSSRTERSTDSAAQRAAERRLAAAERRLAQEEAQAERERASTVRKAEHDVTRARAREAEARQEWERAQNELEEAKRRLVDVQNS